MQQLGSGVEQAQKFSGQVRADDAYNSYASAQNRILYGDPNKNVTNPDGTTTPDTGYYGLKGDAAVRARATVEAQLDSAASEARQGLSSPESQLQFDSTTRRLRTAEGERIGQHAAQQEVTYQQGVHQGSVDLALNSISVNPLDKDAVAHNTADMINARVNAVRLAGGGPEQQQSAIQDARRDATRAQVEAVAAKDPVKALEILDAKKADAGAYYAPLQERLKARADQEGGKNLFQSALNGQGQSAAPTDGSAPAAAPAVTGGLPQEGPMPPARGDGGPTPSADAGTTDAAAPGVVHLPQFEAADKTLSSKTASAADKAEAQKVVDRWNSQSFPQPGLATPTAPAQQQGRDTSPAPLPHPATQAIPAGVHNAPPDGSHSLPPAVPGTAMLPYFSQAGAPYGISGNYLARTKQIESGSGAGNVTSPTGAKGPFQFIPSTWAHYGNGGNPMDFGASTAAAVRLAADNKASLTKSLGREPSDAELYLAHQQGAGGAAKLLANPNVRAGDLLGDQAVRVNGGDPNAPASAFTAMWINKFDGTKGATGPLPMFASGFGGQAYFGGGPPAGALPPIMPDPLAAQLAPAPAPDAPMPSLMQQAPSATQAPPPPQVEQQPQFRDPKADVYARIEASGASAEVKQHAFQAANQYFAQQQIADEQDQRAKKARSDQAYGRYSTAALQGNIGPQILQQVAQDPNLLPEVKWSLTKAIREESTRQGGDGGDAKKFGTGFYDGLHGLTAPEGAPNRITSDEAILNRAGPGGDLTFEGATKLIETRQKMSKNANDSNVHAALVDTMKEYHDRLSSSDPTTKILDLPGEEAFNGKFAPQVYSRFDAWTKDGKNPWDFFGPANRKELDDLAQKARPGYQTDAARIDAAAKQASDAAGQPAPVPPAEPVPDAVAPQAGAPGANLPPIPPPPGNMAPNEWRGILAVPPVSAGSRPWPAQNWAGVFYDLQRNPTPDNKARFDRIFGRPGMKADDVLKKMSGAAPSPIETGDASLAGLQ